MFVIRANVKFANSKAAKVMYAGRDINRGHGDGSPCWCSAGDEDIQHFVSVDAAVAWFDLEKKWLADSYIEVNNIVVSEQTYVDVKTLTI